ncbi:hypothetical protein EDD37DRAFT_633235 [Exophiala viscosa]|uniref:WDR59/RTC1-like RING zinc finger domain-containing protein n=1 Tax=Exophiala viscosa TaxID=2486360 RepID=A0AAN6IBZ9_9EURO|nr:hypothetical protein EDD36DRAFT_281095 [Exophiala viscosa]KAI1622884.1 hypothetical protein EDD37DRAFT_633235 [Exophiala viscosa]
MARRGPASAFESETFGQDASFRLEQPVGSMTISPSGRDVALASKEGLHIIDLDSPYSPPRYLPHRTPWEVADVQWSPFAVRDYWVISTSNQKALVWNLEAHSWQDSIEFVLHGHTRAITDINFSAHNPDVLATCAVDSFVHCWDLRAPARPVHSFSDWFAGATQVKWNRQDEHVIASSHDKYLHVWDVRKGAYPLRTIQAHGTKIYGIDWNRFQQNKIVTCSLDRTIKFWDLDNQEDMPERIIETPFPVWRARHTPFGWGLLVMPQRGNSDLYMYDRRAINGVLESGPVRAVATFPGHEGQVKEFLWRARGSIENGVDNRDFQLVTWGTDRELKLHALEPDTYTDIGYEKGITRSQRLNLTRKGAVYRTFRDEPEDAESPMEQTPRSEMFSRHSHLMPFRPRSSTSVGMNKMPVSQFRGWVQGGRQPPKSAMHGRGNNRQSADPIAWLKNVKISSWDPDTLAEEIRHVGEKFKRVDFEVVDISHRKAVMSLQAPWGEDQSQVFLRLEMRFPKLYPRSANAVLSLQKSGFVDEATHKMISTELHTISETYASRKRGCLEAVLRYLLREQNLEQIVSWVLGESLSDSKILDPSLDPGAVPADESSSDDDDPLVDGARDRLEASANIMVPLAKGCGALWSDTGKLVCFFPTKSKEPVSFLSTLGVKDLEESDSKRLFEGFGRLHTSSPARKAAKTSDNDSDSDTSDSSRRSSSSSSSSLETDHHARGASSYLIGASGRHQRSRSPDRSNQSTTGGPKLNEAPRTTTVSIHTFDDLIPSKRRLAVGYKIMGDGKEVCENNADVALNAGLEDLASAWTLLGLVLEDAVPLALLSDSRHTALDDITVIARTATTLLRQGRGVGGKPEGDAFGRIKWGNHPLGSTYLLPAIFDHFERLADVQMLAMMSCVLVSTLNHGTIPGDATLEQQTGKRGLALPRSDYYPSRAVAKATLQEEIDPEGYVLVDTANLFVNSSTQTSGSAQGFNAQRLLLSNLGRQDSGLSSRAPSFRGDEGPHSATISVSTSPEGNTLGLRGGSSGEYSSARASLSALTQQSYSNSPPNQFPAAASASGLKKYSPSGSLTPGWVSTGIFGGQAGNRSSRRSFHSSEAASQESHGTNVRSSLSSGALRHSQKNGGQGSAASRRSTRTVTTATTLEQAQQRKPARRKKIKTHLFNQHKFDLDGYPESPSMDPGLSSKCSAYRASYAHLLDVWQLFVQRAEVLKFDGLEFDTTQYRASNEENATTNGLASAQYQERLTRKTTTSTSRAPSPALNVKRCCRSCGEPLGAIEKNGIPIAWQCVNQESHSGATSKIPSNSACSICDVSVQGLAVPCLECGHMTCYDCATGWFGSERMKRYASRRSSAERRGSPSKDGSREIEESDDDVHNTCPTGCGCPCATLTTIKVPHPPIEVGLDPQNLHPPLMNRPSKKNTTGMQRSSSDLATADYGADTALAAFLALTQPHQRSKSVTVARGKASSVSAPRAHEAAGMHNQADTGTNGVELPLGDDFDAALTEDDVHLNPWAAIKSGTLGRGIGAGLSRGLSSKGSDATIRKIK